MTQDIRACVCGRARSCFCALLCPVSVVVHYSQRLYCEMHVQISSAYTHEHILPLQKLFPYLQTYQF